MTDEREAHMARWKWPIMDTSRWTQGQIELLKRELNSRLEPFFTKCADALGSLQFDLVDVRAEIARLRAPLGADAMAIVNNLRCEPGSPNQGDLLLKPWQTVPVARTIEAARREARAQMREEALEILHEEGWIGRSEQRIRALPDDPPLLAHPVEGPVDHAALSREYIARYPKIRKRLAES